MRELLGLAAPVMARQHALITIIQAQELGSSREAVRRLVQRGVWQRIDRGLYGPCGVPLTWRRRLMAVVLVAPGGSLISHRAGAALRGVGGLHEPAPEISIPRGSSLRRPGVIVHESTDLELARPCFIDGIPTTGCSRLAMDLGSVVSPRRYVQTVRELRHAHGVTSAELLHTYLRHKRQGRNGGGAMRDWLDRYFDIDGVPESGLEQLVLDALLDAGLPDPVLQWWVQTPERRYRLDIAYPHLLVAIEVDGAQHRDPEIAHDDEIRTKALETLGWQVIRIRGSHLATDLLDAIRRLHHLQVESVVTASAQV